MNRGFIILITIIFMNSAAMASYEDALELFTEQKYKESLKMIADELVIEKDLEPDSPNYKLRFLAAHNHWKLGNTGSAIAHFKRCTEIQKENPDPLVDLSLLFLDMARTGDARFFAKKALEIKEDPIIYYVLGSISMIRKYYWKAKEHFEKAISLDPELFIAYNGLGITLMRLKKYSEANTAFSAAMAMSPESPEILNNMATCLKRMGKLNEAHGHYSTAIAKMPDNTAILNNMKHLKELIALEKSNK